MVVIHLFPKNIKTPMILPYQWLSPRFNVIRSNLSTSSDSSSDSDSDSDKPKSSTKKYKNVDYLNAAKIAQKKREIEKQLTKTAQLLTLTSGKDKEKVLTGLLETISKIQNEDPNFLVKSNENINEVKNEKETKYTKQQSMKKYIDSIDKEKHQRDDLSMIRMQQSPRRRTRYNDRKFETEVDVSEDLSIISMLKRNRTETAVTEPSLIRALQNEQKKSKYVYDKVGVRPDQSDSSSILKMQKDQRSEPSLIRALQNKQKKSKYVYDEVGVRPDQSDSSSISKMQKDQRVRSKYIDEFETNYKRQPEVQSVIQTLKNELENVMSKQRDETKKQQFATRTPLSLQKEARNINNELQTKEGEPSVIRMLKQQWNGRNIEKSGVTDECNVKLNRIFGDECLDSPEVPEFMIWNLCEQKELQSIVMHYPENAFQEMIGWTNQGKLWKFPIDNEQGMEKEHNVHFSKHVFLERHLSPWCPAKGPIRHYMQLVCIGLSKNPYMTFEEKYDHIMWYKDYFSSKQDLLQKLGLEVV